MEKTLPVILPARVINITFSLIAFLSFALPFSLGHPQIIVGSLVNAGLILAALFLPEEFIRPVIILPSLAVLSRGLIFGPLTPYLIYMLPFIWFSNWLLVYIFKKAYAGFVNYWFSLFSSGLIKYFFLFLSAYILFNFKLIPKVFLTNFSIIQLVTVIIGGFIAFKVKKFYERFTRG